VVGVKKIIDLASNLFMLRRWNNKPGLEHMSEAANIGFSLHIGVLMAFIEGADPSKVIKKLILKDLPKCILADISVHTKTLIKEMSKELWDKTYISAIDDLENYIPNEHKDEIRNHIVNAKDITLEGRIVKAADLYAAFKEAEINNRIYPEYYSYEKIQIQDTLNTMRKRLVSLDMILDSRRLRKYLDMIRTLEFSVRWNRQHRNIQTTVAGHTFMVTLIAYLITLTDKIDNDSDILLRAVFHDVPESLTGDIISPTKRRVKGFESVVEEVEEYMISKYINPLIPKALKNKIDEYSLHPFDGEEGKVVRTADLTAAILECEMEIESGNVNDIFVNAKTSMRKEIQKLGGTYLLD
jgi:putative hydrolase of HD superfamily